MYISAARNGRQEDAFRWTLFIGARKLIKLLEFKHFIGKTQITEYRISFDKIKYRDDSTLDSYHQIKIMSIDIKLKQNIGKF